MEKSELSLFIKKYNKRNSFTKLVHELDLAKNDRRKFAIEGPMGRGLELTEASKGTHFIFAAGTGILPFLDLFNFMLMKTMRELLKKHGNSPFLAESINLYNEAFDQLLDPSFNVILVASFADERDFVGKEIVQKLAELSKKCERKVFQAKIRKHNMDHIEALGELKFDKKFFETHITSNMEKIYICGPQNFSFSVYKNLRAYSVPTEKICLM